MRLTINLSALAVFVRKFLTGPLAGLALAASGMGTLAIREHHDLHAWGWLALAVAVSMAVIYSWEHHGKLEGARLQRVAHETVWEHMVAASTASNSAALRLGMHLGASGFATDTEGARRLLQDVNAGVREIYDEVLGKEPAKPQRESPEAAEPVQTTAAPTWLSDERTEGGIPKREL